MSENVEAIQEIPAQQKAALEKIRILQRVMLGSGILAYVFMLYTGWWLVAALVFEILALITGIWSLFVMPRAKSSGFAYTVIVLFLLGIAYLAFGTTIQLIFVEQTNAYAECINGALTIERQGRCSQQLEDQLLRSLVGNR